jgi:hypothetical protein
VNPNTGLKRSGRDAVQIMFHVIARQLLYQSEVMVGRSNSGEVPLAERLVVITKYDINSAFSDNDQPLSVLD